MKTKGNENLAGAAAVTDWPLTAANHRIETQAAQDMIGAYTPAGFGGFFTLNTINGIITPLNAGVRYYFTLYNARLTVMITGVQKIDVGKYDDLYNLKLAVSDSLNAVPAATNQSITLSAASTANRNYRDMPYFADGRKGGMFGIEAIQTIIRQTGCIGIRFYIAKDSSGIKTIVLYGVDSSGQNLTAYAGDQNCPCPNFCGAVNPLNS